MILFPGHSRRQRERDSDPLGPLLLRSEGVPRSFRHIKVKVTTPSPDGYAEGCPQKGEAQALPAHVRDDDFVELTRTGCYGACPAYTVKIHGNGNVEWKGFAHIAVKGTRTAVIEPRKARGLLGELRSSKFWSLCASYSKPITDSPTTTTRVSMNGQSKTVSNYADSAPHWLEEMELKIDDAAETIAGGTATRSQNLSVG